MADETVINGEFSDERTVEVTGDDASLKVSELSQMVNDLEQENSKILGENKGYKQRIEELKSSVEELRTTNGELKEKVDRAESENKALGAVAARAADLEAEVSRLQHDLVSSMSDLMESSLEVSNLKKALEGLKERGKEKDVKLGAIEKERDLLLTKVGNLEGVESSLRGELEGKEKEIRGLKKTVEELEAAVASSKSMEKLKNDLEKTIEKMKGEITVMESSLEEKEKLITGFELKDRATSGGINGDAVVEGGKRGLIDDLKQKDWVLIGGSTIAAVAVMGVGCYLHVAARKQ